jgi:hypothetical protein
MPRKKLRRFDPRFGVTEQMLEAEGVYLGQEFRDHDSCSMAQLREWLKQRQTLLTTAGAHLDLILRGLSNRERLILRCLIARDMYHVAALYQLFLEEPHVADAAGPSKLVDEELTPQEEPIPAVPFTEWLFEDR